MFKRIKTKAAVAVIAGVTLMGGTAAYASHEFTDVPDTNGFHNSISFMKQRGITFGCNAGGTLYCPQDNVTRAQMAAFLERQARVLSPRILGISGSGVTIPAGVVVGVCETLDYTFENYSEWIEVTGPWSMYADPAEPSPIAAAARLQFSLDAGATWNALGGTFFENVNPDSESGSALGALTLNTDLSEGGLGGTSIRFRIRMSNNGTLDATGYCGLTATFTHRYTNPTAGITSGPSSVPQLGDTVATR